MQSTDSQVNFTLVDDKIDTKVPVEKNVSTEEGDNNIEQSQEIKKNFNIFNRGKKVNKTTTENSDFKNTNISEPQDSDVNLHNINLKLNQLLKTNKKQVFIHAVTSFSLGCLLFSMFLNFYLMANQNKAPKEVLAGEVKSEIIDNTLTQKTTAGQKLVNEFTTNKAFPEVGSKLLLQKNQIATKNHTNCQTEILPPEANGCYFTFAPGLLGLGKQGIIFTSIELKGSIGDGNLMQVDLKNYEKSTLEKTLFKIDKTNFSQKFSLPSDFGLKHGLYFKLWDKDKTGIKIDSILVNYFDAENLQEVKLNVVSSKTNLKNLKIYWDKNQNHTFDSDGDILWGCKPNFPGVKEFSISKTGTFNLIRDNSCYTGNKPSVWSEDDSKLALPSGDWLVVGENISFPFQVNFGTENTVQIN